jgi:hypothetical protein
MLYYAVAPCVVLKGKEKGPNPKKYALRISTAVIKAGPLGYFIHASIATPVVSALKNHYIWGFLEAPADILNHSWIQEVHGGFRSETAVTKPFRK